MTEHDGCTGCKYFEKYRHIANTTSDMPCYDCEMAHSQNKLKDKYEPMTNADKIRNMSDEDLAEFLNKMEFCNGYAKGYCSATDCNDCAGCADDNLKWLQNIAKENDSENND